MKQTVIYIAGHRGMVGSAIARELQKETDIQLLTPSRQQLDLCDQQQVNDFFKSNKIDQVYLAAAKVGGILANKNYPADFIVQNLQIQTNVINAANRYNVNKLLFLGSSCIYPRLSNQPIKEEYLLTGTLEPTNEPYAIAKIAGIKLCEAINRQHDREYRSIMPTNLYGPGDNYHPENSHVIPALLRRFHEAKLQSRSSVTVWGSGTPLREFLHVDDLAKAAIHIMNLSQSKWLSITSSMCSHLNVGAGYDLSIAELSRIIAKVVNYQGEIIFDSSMPDGTPRKLLNTEKLKSTGWTPTIDLILGLETAYKDFTSTHT